MEDYTIIYENEKGRKCLADLPAFSKSDAENQFKEVFCPKCTILKTQTTEQWMDELHNKIVDNLSKKLV
jgi:hypothetical protein